MPQYIAVFGIIISMIIFVVFIVYAITTNKIIKSQEEEIQNLESQLRRWKRFKT